jgi:hypothetical protein
VAVLIPLAFGATGTALALTAGATIGTAAIVGVGAAIISHKSGAAGWVYDEIVQPVGKAVTNVLKSDVGQFVVKAAALATGNAWAIPLIDGAATLANGGDFGDALKSAAISYVGGKVGQLGGELASQAMFNAGASEFATQVVSSAAGSGAGRASVALIMGQDPVQAFIQGGISGGLSGAAGWLETNTEGAFSRLPDAARNVITSGLAAVVTGKELTPDLIWNALLTSEGVTEAVGTFLADNTGLANRLTDNQLSALTLGIQRTAAAAFSGGDVPQAILNELNRYGEQEFGKWLDNSAVGNAVNNTLDKITGDYQRAQEQAQKMDGVVRQHSAAVGGYNSTVQEINAGVAEQERLRTLYDRALQNFQANENQANADALVAAVDAFNAHVNPFNERYNNVLKPNLDRYEQQVAALETQFEVEARTYDTFVADLSVSADRVAEDLKPVYTELDKQFVRFMNPNFNEAEYRQIAGLDADKDAYLHWLSTGKEQGLPTNAADYEIAYNEARQRALMGALERTGLDIGEINPQQLERFMAYIDQNYGGDLTRLRNAPQQTLADRFSSEYTYNQRRIEAIDEERRDVNQLLDAWQGGQSLGIAPVITDQVNELLTAAGRPTGLVGEELIQEDIDALDRYNDSLLQGASLLKKTVSDFAPSGATEAEIAAGIARRIIDPDTGLMEWSNVSIQTPFWSPELGAMVYQYAIPLFDKVDTNTAIKGYPEGIYSPAEGGKFTGEYGYLYKNLAGEWVGGVRYQPASGLSDTAAGAVIGQTLADLRETAPAQFIEQAGSLSADAADIIAAQVGREITDLARNAVEYARESDSDFIKDTAAVAIGGTAELAGAINDVLLLAKINPESTPLGRWARDTLALSGDVRSAEFAAASERFSDRFNAAEGVVGALNAIWDNAWDAPGYFFAEYIAQELVQEVPGALAGLVTGGAATIGIAAARRAALEVSQEVGRTIARRAALSSVATLDMAESIGGSAGQGFDTAYSEALNAGMTKAEAIEFAYDTAVSAGVVGGVITGVSMGFLDGNAMERIIANRVTAGSVREATEALAGKIRDGATVMVKEGVQEALEEGAVEAVIASRIVQVNPDYDVAKNITLNATLGAIAGVGVAGGVYTADLITDTLLRVNPTVYNTVNGSGSDPEAIKTALANLGITDAGTQNNLLSTVSDQYHSNADVSRAFSAHPDFRVTNADILNGVLNSAGQDVTTYINTYVDQRYVDIAEVKAAAAAEGVTLTDAQAQDMVTQTNDPNATQAALYSIQQKYDPQGVTAAEARQRFAELGFTPTDAQVNEFVGQHSETAQLNKINTYVNPRQVTEAEARRFFDALGYTPTDQEVRDFMGQGNKDFEATAPDRVGAYVDPRQVTEAEARQFFTDLGYTPTDAQVAEFVAQVEETTQQDVISKYVDPRQVTMDELQAIADEEGLTLTEALAQTYIGQSEADTFQQEQLAAAQQEFDPLATTLEEATQFFADTDYQATPEELAQFVASKAEEVQRNAVGEYVDPRQVTADEARQFLSAIGYQPTDEEVAQFAGQLNDETFQQTRQTEIDAYVDPRFVDIDEVRAAYEALGLSRPTQADLEALVGQYDETDLSGRAETNLPNARYNSIIEQIDNLAANSGSGQEVMEALESVKADLQGQMESLGFKFDAATGEMLDAIAASEDRLMETIAANEEAGMTRDEAIQDAVAALAGELGTTEATLLERIGQTEESLKASISDVETAVEDLGGQLGDVEASLLDRVQELEDAGIARDEALGTALDELATELGVTEENLLQQIGQTEQSLLDQLTEIQTGLESQIGDVETRVLDRVQELEDAGIARDEALGTALGELATELGVTEENLLQQIGQTEQSLLDQLTEIQTGLESQIGDVEASLLDRVQELEDAGIARDEALGTALGELATELGVTEESLLQQIGQTEQSLLDQLTEIQTGLESQIGDVETRVLDRVQELEDAGIQRDTALQTALGELATELGVTEESLLQQIGQTEQSLLDQLTEIQTGLESQIGDVEASLLDRVQELEDAGIARDEALGTALGELATELGVTEESLLAQIGQTEQSLLDQLTEIQTGLESQIGDVEASLLDRVQELEDAGIARDEALGTALGELATELGVTEESLLAQIGQTEQSLLDQLTEIQTGLEGQIGDVEASLLDRVQELEDAGIARDEALGTALGELATELGVTEESLLQQIGQTEQSLLDQLTEIQTGLESQIGDVEASLLDRVQELEDAGIARDEALGTALGELATELGVTEESLLQQIGETEASILDQLSTARDEFTQGLTDVATVLAQQAAQYEAAGIARDEALSQAIDDVATNLGTTRADILSQLGTTEESLLTEIGATEERLGTQFADDMQFVANLIGKPARDVTQVDIDFVADLIAQQEVITDLNMSQRQYDVTGDGLINQDDFALLEQALAGTDVTFAPGSIFGPATGLYAQNQANLDAQLAAEAETQAQIEQQTQNQTQLATQLQTQIETEADAARRRAFGDYVQQQQDLYGQRVDVKTPDPMRINYLYDFQSIFATPQQASLFPSPYAEGGQVEGTTDKLLRIIGELK